MLCDIKTVVCCDINTVICCSLSVLCFTAAQISVRVTFDRGDVDKFVSEAVRLNSSGVTNYQTLVAGGGDGTLNEVVCALMKHKDQLKDQDLSVALLPLGTANDFACVSGISVVSAEHCCNLHAHLNHAKSVYRELPPLRNS